MGRRPKNYVPPSDVISITCTCCGEKKSEKDFYTNKWSRVFVADNHKVPICKDCIQNLFEEYTKRFGEEKALVIILANLDMPFYPDLYAKTLKDNSYFTLGLYIRQLNRIPYRNKTFQNSITGIKKVQMDSSPGNKSATKWSKQDKTNMNYVISVIGYDPFDGYNMTDDDRKYCYNLLSGYCDIDGIKDDSHKMIACIQIVQNQLQIRKIDEMINPELDSPNFDEGKLKALTESKKKLQDNIVKMANENNISSKSNGERRKNTFTQKMKNMSAEGYEPARPNMFDIKTSESFKQVAAISAQCILDQLGFDDSEYSAMVKSQREAIVTLREKNEMLEEENRNLKNELFDLKRVGNKRGV